MREYNKFNLKNRPYLDIPNFSGEDGNPIKLSPLFSSAMLSAGYKEESRYLGGSSIGNIIRKIEGFDYQFITNLIFSLTETNVEMIDKAKAENDDDDDIIIVVKKKKNNAENYLGRSDIYYTDTNDMQTNILKDESLFISKDKIGMTPFDHYLMTEKQDEYILGLQYLYINFDEKECADVINNKFLDQSLIDILGYKRIEGIIYTDLVKYYATKDSNIPDQMCEKMQDVIRNTYKSRDLKDENMISVTTAITNSFDIINHKPENHAITNSLFSMVLNMLKPESEFMKMIKSEQTKTEMLKNIVLIEKEILNNTIKTSPENDHLTIKRRRI